MDPAGSRQIIGPALASLLLQGARTFSGPATKQKAKLRSSLPEIILLATIAQ
jgi:hypothetical protein